MFVSVLTGGSPPPEPEIWGKVKEINTITTLFYCCNIYTATLQRYESVLSICYVNSYKCIFKQMLAAKQTTDINVDLVQILLYNTRIV